MVELVDMEHEICPRCGQPLDIMIDRSGVRTSNACTNPDCGEQKQQDDEQRTNNSYTS